MSGDLQTVAPESDAEGGAESPATYRAHLDGLRAVAVYLVVLFHAGVTRFTGGYIGVDVFFVLSGFLVTQLLLRDVARSNAIGFRRFYARRFRRLLPAAFTALIVTAFVYTAIASPTEVANAVGSFKAAFLYSTNWYFIHQSTGYFGADISSNPVLHFWSLAVEEQFYLVWPVLLAAGFGLTRRMDRGRQMQVLRVAVAIGALASALWALSLRGSDPIRAYYGTDTRAYELLAGAFLALTPALGVVARAHRRTLRAATVVGMAAVLALASSWLDVDAIVRGVAVTVATCVLLLALEAADGGFVKRILSTRPFVYLGKISYSTYLWHWLVILVVVRVFHSSALSTAAITFLLATGVASLSFEMLERPVRMSPLLDRHRGAVIATGLVVSVVSALVFIPRIVTVEKASTSSARSTAAPLLTPVPKNLDFSSPPIHFPVCVGKPVTACRIVRGKGPTIFLTGDSHAWMLIPLFRRIAVKEDLSLYVTGEGSCPWQRGVNSPSHRRSCKFLKQDEYKREIPAVHPDLIVTMEIDYARPGNYPHPLLADDGHRITPDEFAQATTNSVAKLRAAGRNVLLIEPVPLPHLPSNVFNPSECLQSAKDLEQCRYLTWPTPSRISELFRKLANTDSHVYDLNLDRAVCPLFPVCDPVIGGQVVKRDQSHLTTGFALSLVPLVTSYLESNGLITR